MKRMNQPEIIYKSVPISVGQSFGGFDAIALYDNQSESPDELNFRKGDVLKILEKDFNGLAGWWLCALKDRVGLAPGNRLEVAGKVPDKPQNFRKPENKQDIITKMDNDSSKMLHGAYDVPKIIYSDQAKYHQQQTEKQQEIPDILKGQNVNFSSENRSNNNNPMLYAGPNQTPQQEETAYQKDPIYSGQDSYIWPDNVNLIPNFGKQNTYINPSCNGNSPAHQISQDGNSDVHRTNGQRVSPPMNVSTYINLQHPSTGGQNGPTELQQHAGYHSRGGADLQHSLGRSRRVIYSDNDNYDNLAPPTILLNGQQRPKANENNGTFIATTNNNINKNNNNIGNGKNNTSFNFQYQHDPRNTGKCLNVNGSKTLQHRSRRASEENRVVVRDDSDLQMKNNINVKGKRDRSLRRVRFADQVTSSDTEEWTRNSDPLPNHSTLPLKPILSSSNQIRSNGKSNSNGNLGFVNSSHNPNASNINSIRDNDFKHKQSAQVHYQPVQDDIPDYENPYTEIVDPPVYDGPPIGYISTNSKLNVENQGGKHSGKNYTSEFTTVLNGAEDGNALLLNNNNSQAYYKNIMHTNGNQSYIHPHQKKIEGVYISSPSYNAMIENEPEFQLCFVDMPRKEQENMFRTEDVMMKLSPELLNKSREKVQILANSLDGILNRRNADDANVATVIFKSIDVEIKFLIGVGERALKKSVETWSEDLIESLLQHMEDLRTIQGTLAILNKQIMEVTKDPNSIQSCQAFDTICSSCATSGRNICYPVHQFVDYLLPKFKFLLPTSLSDVGRLAPSPTFNASAAGYGSMTKNQLKGKTQENIQFGPPAISPRYSSLRPAQNNLNIPKLLPTGRAPSPIPKLEAVQSYKGTNYPKETSYYEEVPSSQTLPQPTKDDAGLNGKLDTRHQQYSPVHNPLGNTQTAENRQRLAYAPVPSQLIQSRPLPPAPKPPSYSLVSGQTSFGSMPPMLTRENFQQPAPNNPLQHGNFMRSPLTKDSPVHNSNNQMYNAGYNNLNGLNNDSASSSFATGFKS